MFVTACHAKHFMKAAGFCLDEHLLGDKPLQELEMDAEDMKYEKNEDTNYEKTIDKQSCL